MEKNEKKNGLLIFPNIITEQWGSSVGKSFMHTLGTEMFGVGNHKHNENQVPSILPYDLYLISMGMKPKRLKIHFWL